MATNKITVSLDVRDIEDALMMGEEEYRELIEVITSQYYAPMTNQMAMLQQMQQGAINGNSPILDAGRTVSR